MTETLTLRAINRATLARQMLLAREETSVAESTARLCGLQAQEPKPPFLGLWTRIKGFQAEDLHTALDERKVARATMMRGTLHLMAAPDYLSLRSPLQPVLDAGLKVLGPRAKGLNVEQVLPVARGLLQESPRTFNEMRSLLQAEFPEVNERALGFAVRMCLPLVMVPTQDRWGFPRNAAFTLAETWLGEAPSPDSPSALDNLVVRYLAAFGPASAADAQAWSGLPALSGVLDRLRPRLRVFSDERGRELFDLPDAPRPDEATPAPARFLPEFDSLVLAHSDRRRVISDEHRPGLTTKNLRVRATFLWDGFAAGTWETERKRKTATLRLRPFAPLPRAALKELSAEAETLLAFTDPDAADLHVTTEPG
ncbi:winged helix DNA-binding domain-containing protein [Actinomadura rugatobispora]|uniref:Winged helix DNA-binding domain-containing protein n=1 Tax=Actinomadura rugatobispora TaxID=1994 RepID=A0ABW1AGW9_9ACTN|nr:winged helix DNA-binding domain-containing protein [Actinomadura rugatobispora]